MNIFLVLKSLHLESTYSLLFVHKTSWNRKQFISVVTEYRLQKTVLCQSTLSICSIYLLETIRLKLKQSFLSNNRRKCLLSYMDWPIFLGFPFILSFLWIGHKTKKHLSRIFLSFEACRPSSAALHYPEVLLISIRFLSE